MGTPILIAEDAPPLRAFLRENLEGLGYRVLVARDGKVVQQEEGSVDLRITDVIMPNMGGPDLVKQVRSQ